MSSERSQFFNLSFSFGNNWSVELEKPCRWLCFWKVSVRVFIPYACRQSNFAKTCSCSYHLNCWEVHPIMSLAIPGKFSKSHMQTLPWGTSGGSVIEIKQLLCWTEEKSCSSILVLQRYVIASDVLPWISCTHLLNWWWQWGMLLLCWDP